MGQRGFRLYSFLLIPLLHLEKGKKGEKKNGPRGKKKRRGATLIFQLLSSSNSKRGKKGEKRSVAIWNRQVAALRKEPQPVKIQGERDANFRFVERCGRKKKVERGRPTAKRRGIASDLVEAGGKGKKEVAVIRYISKKKREATVISFFCQYTARDRRKKKKKGKK